MCSRCWCAGPARGEDFTRNKNDDIDAMIIARLVTERRCYLPERATPPWARLRHLGARRTALTVDVGAARQQVRDLLECAWLAVLDAASKPLDAANWLAAVTVALERVGPDADLCAIGEWGWDGFAAAVRTELGSTRWYSRVVAAVFAAATDPARAGAGVHAQRSGALERVRFALADLAHARAQIAVVEHRMRRVLDELSLTELAGSIPGVSVIGAATILAESGNPNRFSHARALVKHAGLCPRDNSSGTYQGKTGISGRGRPELRLAARRAVFTALQHNPTRCWPRSTPTSPATPTTRCPTPRPGSRSPPRCYVSCTPSWSPAPPWDASIAAGGDRTDLTHPAGAACLNTPADHAGGASSQRRRDPSRN